MIDIEEVEAELGHIAGVVQDALTRIVGSDPTADGEQNLHARSELGNVEVMSWAQAFGNTSGPWGGVGGQAVTGFRITAVLVGYTLACYAGVRHFRDYDVRTGAGQLVYTQHRLP